MVPKGTTAIVEGLAGASAERTREGEEDSSLDVVAGASSKVLGVEAEMSGGSAGGERDRRLVGGPASSVDAFLLPSNCSGS